MISWLMIAGGLVALTFGADFLVKGASTIAARFGIPSIVIGLTIVAFGTSAPEIAVSVNGAIQGTADISVGNVLGSNIFNILFILGLSALIAPLLVHQQVIRIEVPIMIGAAIFTYFFAQNGTINRFEGLMAFGLLGLYILFQISTALKSKAAQANEKPKKEKSSLNLNIIQIVGGLTLLVLGADFFVKGAIDIARSFGVSELVIGLTIVAAGTSLPEVATSIVAAFKKETDIAVGNVVGSNIFNSLAVLGLSGMVSPKPVAVSTPALQFDFPVSIAVALACFPLFLRGFKIGRLEGLGLFTGYIAYVSFLVLDQMGHPSVAGKHQEMVQYLFPLVALLLIIYGARAVSKKI